MYLTIIMYTSKKYYYQKLMHETMETRIIIKNIFKRCRVVKTPRIGWDGTNTRG